MQRKRKVQGLVVVDLSTLETGSIHIERDIPLDWLERRMKFCEYEAVPKGAGVKLDVDHLDTGVLVRGWVSAVIEVHCGMCLSDIVIKLEPNINTYLLPRATLGTESEITEFTPEDLDREYYEGDIITLDDLIGDAIMLEMPMNPKCGDDCSGFKNTVVEKSQKEVDPRLAPLAGIRINKEN